MESGCGCDPDTVAAVSYEPGVVVNPTMCKGARIAIKPKNKQLFKENIYDTAAINVSNRRPLEC